MVVNVKELMNKINVKEPLTTAMLTAAPMQEQKQMLGERLFPLIQAEVNISPKISICAQPLKMALHRNPATHGSRMVIFLHDSKKAPF